MKIKSIYFTVILITICLFAFLGCNSIINSTIDEEHDFSNLYGEYYLVGCRNDDGLYLLWENGEFAKEFYYDAIIIFNGTNHAKEKVILYDEPGIEDISDWYSYECEYEFDLSNGKFYSFRSGSFIENERKDEGIYNFNNDVLELMYNQYNFYFIYKKE